MKKFGKKVFEHITKVAPTLSAVLLYFMRLKRLPNLKSPRYFAEKLTWLKLYEYADNPLISSLADKYEVRRYIESKGYQNILNEIYGVYDSADEVDFNSLPSKFALKGTHGCGYNIIVNDKSAIDINEVRSRANSWLQERYGYSSVELHYTKIKPRLVVEKNLSNSQGAVPLEYKIFCFNGKVRVIQVSSDPTNDIKRNYFDIDWNELPYGKDEYRNNIPMSKPVGLSKIISIAEELADGFPFVRVDLYADEERVVFGELTFSPAAGCPPIISTEGQVEMGKLLELSV